MQVDPKPFSTVEEQVAKLKFRGVGFADEDYAAAFLLRENYYTVINGYKDVLIDKEKTNLAGDDRYADGTVFRHFELLYLFDKNLRSISMPLLLDAENAMKTAVVYAFSAAHRERDAYLDPACYCSRSDYRNDKYYTKGLIRLLSTLQRIHDNDSHKAYISHYVRNHGCLPLWVLSKCLSFGSTSAFFDYQTQSVKTRTCITLARSLGKKVVGQKDLAFSFHLLPEFRNICAHDERFYCSRAGKQQDEGFKDFLRALSFVVRREDLMQYADDVLSLLDEVRAESPMIETKLLAGMGICRSDLVGISA